MPYNQNKTNYRTLFAEIKQISTKRKVYFRLIRVILLSLPSILRKSSSILSLFNFNSVLISLKEVLSSSSSATLISF